MLQVMAIAILIAGLQMIWNVCIVIKVAVSSAVVLRANISDMSSNTLFIQAL